MHFIFNRKLPAEIATELKETAVATTKLLKEGVEETVSGFRIAEICIILTINYMVYTM